MFNIRYKLYFVLKIYIKILYYSPSYMCNLGKQRSVVDQIDWASSRVKLVFIRNLIICLPYSVKFLYSDKYSDSIKFSDSIKCPFRDKFASPHMFDAENISTKCNRVRTSFSFDVIKCSNLQKAKTFPRFLSQCSIGRIYFQAVQWRTNYA